MLPFSVPLRLCASAVQSNIENFPGTGAALVGRNTRSTVRRIQLDGSGFGCLIRQTSPSGVTRPTDSVPMCLCDSIQRQTPPGPHRLAPTATHITHSDSIVLKYLFELREDQRDFGQVWIQVQRATEIFCSFPGVAPFQPDLGATLHC